MFISDDYAEGLTRQVGLANLVHSFEGVWAVHTTVIRAADQREVGNLVRNRAPKSTDVGKFAEMLRFPALLSNARSQ